MDVARRTCSLTSMITLRGKNAVLTGASRGLGAHIARALAREGTNLALAARSQRDLDEVRAEVEALGVRAIAVRCDVAQHDDRHRLVETAERELGPVDALVNNAGIDALADYTDLPDDEIRRVLQVNLEAPMLLTKLVLPRMLAAKTGFVVNVSSLAGKSGTPFHEAYSASKFGLVGFTHALRASYRGSGVSFSVVCPGFVAEAGMFARMEAEGARAPGLTGVTTPAHVAAAVVDAIKRRRAEVIVNATPVRPLLALATLAPSLSEHVLALSGVTDVMRKAAAARRSGRPSGS